MVRASRFFFWEVMLGNGSCAKPANCGHNYLGELAKQSDAVSPHPVLGNPSVILPAELYLPRSGRSIPDTKVKRKPGDNLYRPTAR